MSGAHVIQLFRAAAFDPEGVETLCSAYDLATSQLHDRDGVLPSSMKSSRNASLPSLSKVSAILSFSPTARFRPLVLVLIGDSAQLAAQHSTLSRSR